jgi:multiple antibiotic resistance protein
MAAVLAFDLGLFLEAFVLLFSILDPLGLVPVFLALTEGTPPEKTAIVVKRSVIVATMILYVFAYVGWLIFDVLGITLNDFRIAGGVILFIVAVEQLTGSPVREKNIDPEEVAVFPLATPLLAGPGAISTVVIIANPPYGPLVTFVVITLNGLISYFVLLRSSLVKRILGANGTKALSRIMALLIAAIAISFLRLGIEGILASLG